MKDRFLCSLKGQKVDHPPIWFMRQAGRFLFEYRFLRSKSGSFLDLCFSSDFIVAATLQPIKRYDLDAVIVFSDILLLPFLMGLKLEFVDGLGPFFLNPIRNVDDINKLHDICFVKDFIFVLNAINIIVKELNDDVPLIGFSGSPWTLAVYMVEGKITKNFSFIKKLLYSNTNVLHTLLKKLEKNIINYLCCQIDYGAKILMIFDTWGGVLPIFYYKLFSFDYIINIIKEVKLYKNVPFIIFSKGINRFLFDFFKNESNIIFDVVSFDDSDDMFSIVNKTPVNIAIQGNLDPCVLYSDDLFISKYVNDMLKKCYNRNKYIFNLGHGVYPDVNPYSLELIINIIKMYKN